MSKVEVYVKDTDPTAELSRVAQKNVGRWRVARSNSTTIISAGVGGTFRLIGEQIEQDLDNYPAKSSDQIFVINFCQGIVRINGNEMKLGDIIETDHISLTVI